VEDRAIVVSLIVAAKTAEADYVFITGTDFDGVAQTEAIDVTAGNGTYVTTKKWNTITNLDCSDNAAGGGTQWADGTLRVTQARWGFIWDYVVGANWKIDGHFDIGDASTSTYFSDAGALVYFENDIKFTVTNNATLQLGRISVNYGYRGSLWSFGVGANHTVMSAGTFLLYASTLYHRTARVITFSGGTLTSINSIFQMNFRDDQSSSRKYVFSGGTINLTDTFFTDVWGLDLQVTPNTFQDVHVHRCFYALSLGGTPTLTGLNYTDNSGRFSYMFNCQASVIDPVIPVAGTIFIGNEAGWIKEQYTCNIKVCDKDGTGIVGATVLCEGSDSGTASTEYDTQAFSVDTGASGVQAFSVDTGASGVLAEQTITARKWVGTSETLTNYNYFRFTISEPGYETLIIEKVTIDAPINWHLELQQQKQPPKALEYGI
jgi:hypothetical protein